VSKYVSDMTGVSLFHQHTMPVVKQTSAQLSIENNHHVTTSTSWVDMISRDQHWLGPIRITQLHFIMRESSYCFQCVLAIAILSVHLSVRHMGRSVKNVAS